MSECGFCFTFFLTISSRSLSRRFHSSARAFMCELSRCCICYKNEAKRYNNYKSTVTGPRGYSRTERERPGVVGGRRDEG